MSLLDETAITFDDDVLEVLATFVGTVLFTLAVEYFWGAVELLLVLLPGLLLPELDLIGAVDNTD